VQIPNRLLRLRAGQAPELLPFDPTPTGSEARLSGDGRRLAVNGLDGGIRIFDLEGGRDWTVRGCRRVYHFSLVWEPGGTLLCADMGRSPWAIVRAPAEPGGEAEVLVEVVTDEIWLGDVSPDGQRLLFYDFVRGAREHEVKEMVIGRGDRGSVLFKERDLNGEIRYSPDGRWIAYVSGASGSLEVWIRSATGGSPRIASRGGGKSPAWSRDGGRLYFEQNDAIVEVEVRGEQVPEIGPQEAVVDLPPGFVAWEATPRAGEFVATQKLPGMEPPTEIHVILNWFEEVRRLAGSR